MIKVKKWKCNNNVKTMEVLYNSLQAIIVYNTIMSGRAFFKYSLIFETVKVTTMLSKGLQVEKLMVLN